MLVLRALQAELGSPTGTAIRLSLTQVHGRSGSRRQTSGCTSEGKGPARHTLDPRSGLTPCGAPIRVRPAGG